MKSSEKFHFIGIGGIGMSGLARILLKKNAHVSGSDMSASYVTDGLSQAGAKVFFEHASHHIPEQATVIYSTDIKKDNPEYAFALNQKYSMMHRSDLLLHLMEGYKTLAIAGTHGKTTTSALLAWVMYQSGKDPSFAVGGMIPQFQSNAGHGDGEYFVAEADESDGTFLKYHPYGAIVTNIDSDHISHYGNMENLKIAFGKFLNKVENPAYLFWCGDDPDLQKISPQGISYGYSKNCQLKISQYRQKGWGIYFNLELKNKHYKDIQLSLIGKHNSLNGAAVFGLALSLGIPEEEIRKAFLSFAGIMRRCEKKGELQNILFLDDYAHHPTEIKTTLQGIRQAIDGRRLIAVFQPHRYTRTKDCLGQYKGIFNDADEIYITEIYGAGEAPIENLSSLDISQEIESEHLKKCHITRRQELPSLLAKISRTHDVIVTLGAGDITKVSYEVMNLFKEKAPTKLKVGILFGGRSTEHEVTFLSANHICNCVSLDNYEVQHFGITKQNGWISGYDSMQRLKQYLKNPVQSEEAPLTPSVFQELLDCDVVVPVFHGPYGEDGTIQGFFETLDKAYVGTDFRSASICMDKAHTKYLMQAHQIPTLPFYEINSEDWLQNPNFYLDEINKLTFPVFVKPVHLGSSIGVQKVDVPYQLEGFINKAFQYDYKIIVESGLVNLREIEFAVLGNEKAITFPPGEVIAEGKVYDYDSKYSPNGMTCVPRASLNEEKIQEGMQWALKAYRAVGCTGMARVDFFLDSNEKFWLNEINPIPGFTPFSLYPKICEFNGINGKDLLDRLIIYALERKRKNTILCRNR